MKFERCPDCGLMYDRHVRGGHCPHCKEFATGYFVLGIAILIFLSSVTVGIYQFINL